MAAYVPWLPAAVAQSLVHGNLWLRTSSAVVIVAAVGTLHVALALAAALERPRVEGIQPRALWPFALALAVSPHYGVDGLAALRVERLVELLVALLVLGVPVVDVAQR